MIILGVDPGYATTGIGVVEKVGSKHSLLYYGAVVTNAQAPFVDRLLDLSSSLKDVVRLYSPSCAAVEELFFNTNVKTALSVAQARGVILLTLKQMALEVYGYTPLQVKTAVCGYGRAEKKQVQYMVQKLLNLSSVPKPDDAADALAIALCHSHSV
jgi:crossover junction endodeoxyribonuclease RuvC